MPPLLSSALHRYIAVIELVILLYDKLAGAMSQLDNSLTFMARQIFSDVAGISRCVMPNGANASTMAFITAGREPEQPASPQPFTPKGLEVAGDG